MNSKKWWGIAAGGTLAALIAVGTLAPQVSFAQDTPPTTLQRPAAGAWLTRAAAQLGVSEDDLATAINSVGADVVTEAVAADALTQAEGDAILATLGNLANADIASSGFDLRALMVAANAIDFDVPAALTEALGVDVAILDGEMGDQLGGRPGGMFGDMLGGMFGPMGRGQADRPMLTEEEQAAMTARRAAAGALRPYLEAETFQNAITQAHQDAIDSALADGAITAEQATLLQERFSGEDAFPMWGMGEHGGFDGAGRGHGRGHGGMGPRGFAAPDSSAPDSTTPATPEDSSEG